uniref:Uncharacterized protein n=1 Tax=Stomoxys calcitrans TaxID=35570 RepID=A0A1I8PS87_STOCA
MTAVQTSQPYRNGLTTASVLIENIDDTAIQKVRDLNISEKTEMAFDNFKGQQSRELPLNAKPIRIIKRNCSLPSVISEKLSISNANEANKIANKENFAQNERDLIKSLCEGQSEGVEKLSITSENQDKNGLENIDNSVANDLRNSSGDVKTNCHAISLEVLPSTSNRTKNIDDEHSPVLNCEENYLCFCSPASTSGILSVFEKGYVLGLASEQGVNGEDSDGDDNDLPNYSQSCVYEQRIIDFENFRIIEQVVDSNCEGKHEENNTARCHNGHENNTKSTQNPKSWQEIFQILPETLDIKDKALSKPKEDEQKTPNDQNQVEVPKEPSSSSSVTTADLAIDNNSEKLLSKQQPTNKCHNTEKSIEIKHPIYTNPSINFSCSELVSFIGDSFKLIDSAQALYKNETKECKEFVPRHLAKTKSKEVALPSSSSLGNSPFRRSKRSFPTVAGNRYASNNRSVDDNNNTRRYTGITAAERLMQSLNCEVSRELATAAARKDRREGKAKGNRSNNNASDKNASGTPTKTLLKALKSKLTPLAPPFQPSSTTTTTRAELHDTATKNGEVASSNPPATSYSCSSGSSSSATATYLNYEQTTIYYQQQQLQQQQQMQHQNQQQLLVPSPLSSLMYNFPTTATQQQVSPANLGHHQQQTPFPLGQQQQQHILVPQQQQQHFLPHPHHHHQQHCAQNILAMMGQGVPHIHLPASGPATNSGNFSASTAVVPLGQSLLPGGLTASGHTHILPVHLVSTMAGGDMVSWPMVETAAASSSGGSPAVSATLFMDSNGDLHSICPAHGPPANTLTLASTQPHMTAASIPLASPPSGAVTHALNTTQYPTAAYQQQMLALSNHHHNHLQGPQAPSLQQQHQTITPQASTIALVNGPLRFKATSNCNNFVTTSSSCPVDAATSAHSSTPTPRVVLQLDAGASLPLQISGKRKLIQGK